MALSQAQKDALAALLADDDGDQDEAEPDETDDEADQDDDGDQDDEADQDDTGDTGGGDVLVLRGARADSFLDRFLGVTPAAPAKRAAKKAAPPAKKAAPPAKRAAKKAAPPPQDPPPPRAKFF